MKTDKLDDIGSITAQFRNFDIYSSDIVVQHGSAYDPRMSDIDTFSRYSWSNDHSEILYKDSDDEEPSYLTRFFLNTTTVIGIGAPLPDEEEIPEEKVAGTIAIRFNVEYISSNDPSGIDIDTFTAIERMKVFNDAYPFWREALQSLAMRARLPVPMLPAQRPEAMLLSLVSPLHKVSVQQKKKPKIRKTKL